MPSIEESRPLSLSLFVPAFCGLLCLLMLLSEAPVVDASVAILNFAGLGVASLIADLVATRWPHWRKFIHPVAAGALIFLIYSALSLAIPWLIPEEREWFLLGFDRRWLGYFWESWWSGFNHPLLSDGLQLLYVSFYLFPFLFGLRLAWKRDWSGLYSGTDRLILGFLLCYCGYMLVPTRSPYAFVEYSEPLLSYGLQPKLHAALVETAWTKRDCFPSGHTMMSVYLAWLGWQRVRELSWILIPWAVLTVVATLYLRYHFLIDVLVGLATCAGWIWLSERLFGRFREHTGSRT